MTADIEEIEEKVEKLKEMIVEWEKKRDSLDFTEFFEFVGGDPVNEVFFNEILKLQEEINGDLDDVIAEYQMDFVGESGRYYGYDWYTTDIDADKYMDFYCKYTQRGLEDVIFLIKER